MSGKIKANNEKSSQSPLDRGTFFHIFTESVIKRLSVPELTSHMHSNAPGWRGDEKKK